MPVDGGCQDAGLPPGVTAGLPLDMPCPPGETPLEGGGCQPAGVPPEACGEGFEPDGRGGCSAILPEDPCPPGLMAIPGDTECHEVAPCGDGDYGTIPVEATTQFVNAAYTGSDSDGSRAKPWKHIQSGIRRAQRGAIVAVAAGRYAEDVLIQGKPVRLWGRCPALVEVVGTGAEFATLKILRERASHSEVRGLAITGPGIGISTSGATEVVVDHAWIHDTTDTGIDISNSLGPSGITVSGSLIEATTYIGILAIGSEVTAEATVVRSTQPWIDGSFGRGIHVQYEPNSSTRSTLTLRTSLLEQNHDVAMSVMGSNVTIEAVVVRDTRPRELDGDSGGGIIIEIYPGSHIRSTATLSASLVEHNHDSGVHVLASDATIEATVVRGTKPRAGDGEAGVGIVIDSAPDIDERANVTLRASLLERNHDAGVHVRASDATIEATVVRNTRQSTVEANFGRGISIMQGLAPDREPSQVTLRTSLVEHNHDSGVFVSGSDAKIEAIVVRDTQRRKSDGSGGRGIEIGDAFGTPARANVTLFSSLVERNHNIGVLVSGSDATIESTVVRDTQPDADGTSGGGIAIYEDIDTQERARTTVRTSVVERNGDVGVLIAGSDATIEATVVRDTQPRKSDGRAGVGIAVQNHSARASVTLRTSLIEQNHHAGMSLTGSDVMIEATVVRETRPIDDGTLGRGITIYYDGIMHERANVTLSNSLVEQNRDVGVLVSGSNATIDATVVRATQRGADGRGGRGVSIQEDRETHERANAIMRSSLVEQNHDIGVSVAGSDATIDTTVVRDTESNLDGTGGDGVSLLSIGTPATATIISSRIESNARAGIANFSAAVTLVSSTVQCNMFNLNGEKAEDLPFADVGEDVDAPPPTFDGSKANLCGCEGPASTCPICDGLASHCPRRSAGLSPPKPVSPAEPLE
ncbi:right-handed parallel beta-helix repeat-containing protein [Sorangium sp. So ce136]|uniref:right-handed parallel beta-helix repeat-containing protein n=1 Tax=Sorangium sp. So ce136 TaxID=3133284 RepID=UPI003F0F564C